MPTTRSKHRKKAIAEKRASTWRGKGYTSKVVGKRGDWEVRTYGSAKSTAKPKSKSKGRRKYKSSGYKKPSKGLFGGFLRKTAVRLAG